MFTFFDPGPLVQLKLRAEALCLVDAWRSLTLREIGVFGVDEARLFELTWKHRAIPVFASVDKSVSKAGLPVTTHRIEFIGDVPNSFLKKASIGPFEFSDSKERDQAVAYAIEALTVFGYSYKGLLQPAAASRVIGLDGRSYTRVDFGYTESAKSAG